VNFYVVPDNSIRDRIIGDHEPSYRRVSSNNDLANNESVMVICHNFLNNWRNNMPVQMIELEEVTMVEVSDEALEAGAQKYVTTQPGESGCPW
jgi:hypothetical protein